jgi:hypothetical protein
MEDCTPQYILGLNYFCSLCHVHFLCILSPYGYVNKVQFERH